MRQAPTQAMIGQAMRDLRLEAGMTQDAVGRAAGIDATAISRIEAGRRDLRLSTAFRLLAAMDADMYDFAAAITRAQSER